MTATDSAAPPNPSRRAGWLKAALVASLALNLAVIGGGVARILLHDEPQERMSGVSQMQLIPRKFFGGMDRPRRLELLQVLKDYGPRFRDGRKAARDEIVSLASALEAEPYDPAKVKEAVNAFSARSGELVAAGGEAALNLIGMLSPDERKLLARYVRQRGDGGHRQHGGGPGD